MTITFDNDVRAALEGFVPFSGSDEVRKIVGRWTKYNRADQAIFNVTLDEEDSLVLVRNPNTNTLGVVWRRILEKVELTDAAGDPNGKTFYDYEIVAIRSVESLEEGKALLDTVRDAREATVASEVEGFGTTVSEPVKVEGF